MTEDSHPMFRTGLTGVLTLLAGLMIIVATGCERSTAQQANSPVQAAAVSQLDGRAVPPTLRDVRFPESKFGTCGKPIPLCAEARANDNSSIRFEWRVAGRMDDDTAEQVSVTNSSSSDSRLRECIDFRPNDESSVLEIRAVRAEPVPGPSGRNDMYLYDSLSIPIYAEGPDCGPSN